MVLTLVQFIVTFDFSTIDFIVLIQSGCEAEIRANILVYDEKNPTSTSIQGMDSGIQGMNPRMNPGMSKIQQSTSVDWSPKSRLQIYIYM